MLKLISVFYSSFKPSFNEKNFVVRSCNDTFSINTYLLLKKCVIARPDLFLPPFRITLYMDTIFQVPKFLKGLDYHFRNTKRKKRKYSHNYSGYTQRGPKLWMVFPSHTEHSRYNFFRSQIRYSFIHRFK